MQVFISWSGSKSRELGEVLRNWIPSVLQNVTPYFTPSDIEKGSKWQSEIAGKLEKSQIGILCLTKESLNKPWLVFEAGALSKSLSRSKVCPVLFGIDSADIEGPLVQFQATTFSRPEIRNLMMIVNKECGEQGGTRLPDETFNKVFDKWWPELESEITATLKKNETDIESEEVRTEREILEEILTLNREMISKRATESQRLSPRLYEEIFGSYARAVKKVGSRESYEDIMEPLEGMQSALRYLVMRVWSHDARAARYEDTLNDLSFNIEEPPFLPIDDDSEIPF